MHPNKRKKAKRTKNQSKGKSFKTMNPNAAGIDIGSEEHWVAIPEGRDEQAVRRFTCFTEDLHKMAKWLKQCSIETVVMESTGVYWIPPFQMLESYGFDVKLVNARHVKNVPGRKTDVLDCQWLQQLHTYGLLNGSFRPDDSICILRSYWRHRDNLIRYASAHIQHMQKALGQMNIQLHKVISDITGVSGMRIIKAILAGERDRLKLAQMKDYRIKSSTEKIAKSLEGDYREEHLFSLNQALDLYNFYQQKIEECDLQIEKYFNTLDSKKDINTEPLPPRRKKSKRPKGNAPKFDLRTHLYRITGVDFTQIDGLDATSVHTILTETGIDHMAFPNEKHFTSWLGLCPNNRITGGKVKSSRTKKVVNRAANAFRVAAHGLSNSISALGGYYRRMRSRLGAPKAITATAHKLARIFFYMWKNGGLYQDPGADYYEQKYRERIIQNMMKKARRMGYEINLKPIVQVEVS